MEFITKNGFFYDKLIHRDICNFLLNNEIDKRTIIPYIQKIVPPFCDGEKLIGLGEIELYNYGSYTTRKKYNQTLYDENGNNSLATLYLFCNDANSGHITFYPNLKNKICLSNPNATHFDVRPVAGNAVIITNKVGYIEHPIISENVFVLKIPIFYSSSYNIPIKQTNKKVSFLF